VNEPMNAGCSVIVSDQVGCGPDLVKDGENGHIFKARDVEQLYKALENILGDPQKCRAMGQKSFEIIRKWRLDEDVVGLMTALKWVTIKT
jgi:glycosyltransferase involved in cell wall biosynthesis